MFPLEVNPTKEQSENTGPDDWFTPFRFRDETGLEVGCSEKRIVFSFLEYPDGEYERIFKPRSKPKRKENG